MATKYKDIAGRDTATGQAIETELSLLDNSAYVFVNPTTGEYVPSEAALLRADTLAYFLGYNIEQHAGGGGTDPTALKYTEWENGFDNAYGTPDCSGFTPLLTADTNKRNAYLSWNSLRVTTTTWFQVQVSDTLAFTTEFRPIQGGIGEGNWGTTTPPLYVDLIVDQQWSHTAIPLNIVTGNPVDTILYYRVRQISNQLVTGTFVSNWSNIVSVTLTPTGIDDIIADAISSDKIQNDAVTNLKLVTDAIDARTISPDSLNISLDELLLFYSFDNVSDSVLADNYNNNDATFYQGNSLWNTPVVVNGKVGKSVFLDSANFEYALCNAPILSTIDGSEEYTLSAFVKTVDSNGAIISQYGNISDPLRFSLSVFNNKLAWRRGGSTIVISDTDINDNLWHFVTGTRASDGTVTLFIDAIAQTGSGNDSQVFSNSNTHIGADDANTNHLNGLIDEVRIYNRILSQPELKVFTIDPESSGSVSKIIQTETTIKTIVGDVDINNVNLTTVEQNSSDISLRAEAWITIRDNVIVTATLTNVTLDANASAVDDIYNGYQIIIGSEVKTITDYVGFSKIATIDTNWITIPADGTSYELLQPQAGAKVKISSEEGGYILLDAEKIIATGTVVANNIATNAITTEKIITKAITAEKIVFGGDDPNFGSAIPDTDDLISMNDLICRSTNGVSPIDKQATLIEDSSLYNLANDVIAFDRSSWSVWASVGAGFSESEDGMIIQNVTPESLINDIEDLINDVDILIN